MSEPRAKSLPLAAEETDLVRAVVRFARLLRLWGARTPTGGARVALRALRQVDVTRREDFRCALRVALVNRPEDLALFDYLFNSYWRRRSGRPAPTEELPNRPVDQQRLGRSARDDEAEGPRGAFRQVGVSLGVERSEGEDARRAARAARSGAERGELPEREGGLPAEIDRVARAFSAALALRPSRRRVPDPLGRQPDPRATLRRSLRHGGIPVELRHRRRRIARSRLLLFCDVSRSMDPYAPVLLEFGEALRRRAWRVEVFLFASELVRLEGGERAAARSALREAAARCGGGTQIGEGLRRFLEDYGSGLLGRGTVVVVLSDGLDAGEPEVLAAALRRIRRGARAVVWLNPLLSMEGYEPRARGMAAALPYVDVFAPAHDTESLWEAIGAIEGLTGRRASARSRVTPGRSRPRGARSDVNHTRLAEV